MPVPEWLSQFGQRCAALPGVNLVVAETGLTVALRGREVQLDADRDDSGRAVLWTELNRPAGADNRVLAAAAMAWTTAMMPSTGLAAGFNPKVRLLMLGRSIEREALAPGNDAALLDGLLVQAQSVETAAAGGTAPHPAGRPGAPDPRFKTYVADALAAADIEPPDLDGNRLLLKVADRWLEMVYAPDSGCLMFVGLVAAGSAVKADLVGQFNAYNLFHGGYALISPPDTDAVYLAQCHTMALLPAADALQRLADFADRAVAAGAWYMTWKEPAAAA